MSHDKTMVQYSRIGAFQVAHLSDERSVPLAISNAISQLTDGTVLVGTYMGVTYACFVVVVHLVVVHLVVVHWVVVRLVGHRRCGKVLARCGPCSWCAKGATNVLHRMQLDNRGCARLVCAWPQTPPVAL